MTLQSKLKACREAKGLSVAELAKRSGVSIPYIYQIEKGSTKNPTGEILRRLATGLGTTVADLIGTSLDITDEALAQAPPSLQEMARRRGKRWGLRQEDVEMLQHIHFRGRQPDSMEDWELIFLFLKRLLG